MIIYLSKPLAGCLDFFFFSFALKGDFKESGPLFFWKMPLHLQLFIIREKSPLQLNDKDKI